MVIDHTRAIKTKMCWLNMTFPKDTLNFPPQTLLSWNGLALAHLCWVHCLDHPNMPTHYAT
jgi:hypothetical protein